MNSSNQSDKKLSGTQNETTEPNTTDATALTRPTDTPSPAFRADREHSERADFPQDRSALVRALSGLLHALVTEDTESSTSIATDGTTIDESTAYTERTASKGEYGSRTEPVDGVYGHTVDGDPVVAPTGRLAASRIDANWTPGDTLYEPDKAGAVTAATGTNASFLFAEQSGDQATTFAITYDHTAGPTLVDPNGERMIGVASGLEPTMPRTAPATTQEPARSRLASVLPARSRSKEWDSGVDHELLETLPAAEQARLRRLRALDIPTDPTPEDATEGVPTAELEVQTPDGQLTPLGELFDEPEQFARSSLESIECSLAVEAEMRRVTDGILTARTDPDIQPGDVELIGHAKWLANRYDEYATQRPSNAALAAERATRQRAAYKRRISPLTSLTETQHEQVSAMIDRLQSDAFDRVVELRKSRLMLGLELAQRVLDGDDTTTALLTQADLEATDPQNVLRVGNVRYAPVSAPRRRFATQGTVFRLFEDTHPAIKQAGLLGDDTGVMKFAIWKKSEWDETRPMPDPNDDGRTLLKSHRHPDLRVGDVVRCENVVRGWYNGDPTFETRRDSTLTIVERATAGAAADQAGNATNATAAQRVTDQRRPGPTMTGTPVSKHPIAYWRGSERWVFPITDWTPAWWLEQDAVTTTTEQSQRSVTACPTQSNRSEP